MKNDDILHPDHYTKQVPGIECKDVTQHFNFNRGNIIKYAWRCGDKGEPVKDLKKIIQYAEFEIDRVTKEAVRKAKELGKKIVIEMEDFDSVPPLHCSI